MASPTGGRSGAAINKGWESNIGQGTAIRGMSCANFGSGEVMSLDETFQNLSSFLSSLDAEGEQKFELSHSLVIICPDCGKNIAFRGRCPKCGGNSWIPAGHAGGIFERIKAQRWREMISTDDDTLSGRRSASDDDADVAA